MKFEALPLKGAFLITKESKFDKRGSFTRTFCAREFQYSGLKYNFVQHNQSFSKYKGTLRGLHFQNEPFKEVKVVTCTQGKIYDVIVDIRKNSSTFLKWYGVELSAESNNSLYIPEGFAHGFITLVDNSEISYLVSNYYESNYEDGIHYMDSKVNITWPVEVKVISEKDENRAFLTDDFKGI